MGGEEILQLKIDLVKKYERLEIDAARESNSEPAGRGFFI